MLLQPLALAAMIMELLTHCKKVQMKHEKFKLVSETIISCERKKPPCAPTPDCKVWHFRRDLVGAGPTWLVRIWCGFCGSGADLEWCGAEMARRGWRCGDRQRRTEPATRMIKIINLSFINY